MSTPAKTISPLGFLFVIIFLGLVTYFMLGYYPARIAKEKEVAQKALADSLSQVEIQRLVELDNARKTREQFVSDSIASALAADSDTMTVIAAAMENLELKPVPVPPPPSKPAKLNKKPASSGNSVADNDDFVAPVPTKKAATSDAGTATAKTTTKKTAPKASTSDVTNEELMAAHGLTPDGEVADAPAYTIKNKKAKSSGLATTNEFTARGSSPVDTSMVAPTLATPPGPEYVPVTFTSKTSPQVLAKALEYLGYTVAGKVTKANVTSAMKKVGLSPKTLADLYNTKQMRGGDSECALVGYKKTGNLMMVNTPPSKPVACGNDMRNVKPVELALTINALGKWGPELGDPYAVNMYPEKLEEGLKQFPGGLNQVASDYLNSSACNNKINIIAPPATTKANKATAKPAPVNKK